MLTGKGLDKDEIKKNWKLDQIFQPDMEDTIRSEKLTGWQKAVKRSLGWEKE